MLHEQLVCLESLRHKTSCPKDTMKKEDRYERNEKQNHTKQERSDESSHYSVLRTGGKRSPCEEISSHLVFGRDTEKGCVA